MGAIRRCRSVIFRGLFLLVVSLASAVPEDSVALEIGVALSASLFDTLQDAGLAPEKQYLSEIHQGDFPYNVIVTLPFAVPQDNATLPAEILALVISQADCAPYFDDWLKFLSGLRSDTVPVTTQFVFTANDTSLLPPQEQVGMPAGTLQYIETFENHEKLCVLVLAPANAGPFVLPGAGAINAPLWLTSQLPFPIFGTLLSLYRLNLTAPDVRLAALREREIASAALIWNPNNETETESVFSGLRSFLTAFTFGAQNDFNYSIIPNALENIIVNESDFIALYAVIAALCLLYLCVFVVSTRKWQILLLPLFLAATAVLFFYTDFAGIVLRLLLVFIAFSLLNTLLNIFFHIDPAIYGTLFVLQTALNLLVFGTLDAELLLLFTVEFIIALAFFRGMRRIAFCGIAAVLSAICYIYIAQRILVYADYNQIHLAVHSGILADAVLACISLPFLLLWARSQTQVLVFLKQKNMKLPSAAALGVAATVLIAVGIFVLSLPLARGFIFRRPLPDASEHPVVMYGFGDGVSLESRVDVYFDQEIVVVTAQAELPIIRCNIRVQPLKGNAVIYSGETAAVVSDSGAVDFSLNEYPPNPLTVSYIAERNLPSTVMVEFFLLGENGAIIHTQTEIGIH